jgi:hypothetical protein
VTKEESPNLYLPFAFSVRDLRINEACDLDSRIANMALHLGKDPKENEKISSVEWWALSTTLPRDIAWSLRFDFEHGHHVAVPLAIDAAKSVLSVFESVYPEKGGPRLAIQAAEAVWSVPPHLRLKRHAAAITAARGAAKYPSDAIATVTYAASAAYFAAMAAAIKSPRIAYAALTAASSALPPDEAKAMWDAVKKRICSLYCSF